MKIVNIAITGQTATNGTLTLINTSGGALADVNLMNPSVSNGLAVYIIKTTTDLNTFTLKSPAGTINGIAGATGLVLGGDGRQGFIAISNGTDWLVTPYAQGTAITSSLLMFGAGNVAATTVTRFLTPGYDGGVAPTFAISVPMTRSGTLQRMFVLQRAPAGNGNAIVYAFRKNSIVQTLSVSIASTTAAASNIVNSFTYVAGDQIDVTVTKAASVGASPGEIVVVAELIQ